MLKVMGRDLSDFFSVFFLSPDAIGEGDDGQSEPVLKLPLHQGASRTVQIVSIGLHFYFGHSEASSAASELNVCHADSPNGKSDYGFHPAAPCISFQELMEELM